MNESNVQDSINELKRENKLLLTELLFTQKCLKLLEDFRNCSKSLSDNCICDRNKDNKSLLKQLDIDYNQLYEDIENKLSNNDIIESDGYSDVETDYKIEKKSIGKSVDSNGLQSNLTKEEIPLNMGRDVVNYSVELNEGYHRIGDGPIKCHECDITFKFFRPFLRHLNVIHNKCLDKTTQRFHCNWTDCQFTTHAFRFLTQHLWIHRQVKSYTCDWPGCDKAFVRKGSLKLHNESHIGIRPHVCEICCKKFKTKTHLKDHSVVHTKAKPHSCEWPGCETRFGNRQSLNRHRKSVHRLGKEYICEWPGCTKSFFDKQSFVVHMRIHEGIRPYKCKFDGCNHRTHSMNNMSKHYKCIHK